VLLLLLVDVDAVVVVVVGDLSEKAGAVYPEAVAEVLEYMLWHQRAMHASMRVSF